MEKFLCSKGLRKDEDDVLWAPVFGMFDSDFGFDLGIWERLRENPPKQIDFY